ncbi:hypothetical protein MKW98_000043 [Papaver atlanticum]|uniref:R13L1/DRL21-like LRR repeat region domain-containing protein n=1 Tax=Papaver atlanticum TaxID=357466 RepID=A0AAD4SBH2_9MAGN|nr:hypothetical protein MKW98_000043 [Papaver atlanticum]
MIGGFSDELDSFLFPIANVKKGNLKGQYFPSLRDLSVTGWPKLSCLPDQSQYLTSLESLRMSSFGSLKVLPEWFGKLVSLSQLNLYDCQNLKHMPSREQMPRLTSLEKLEIHNCRLLAKRCKQGGEEYNKISHIPKVELSAAA